MTIVQSGFYWHTTKGKEKHFYRGFDNDCIERKELEKQFRRLAKLKSGHEMFIKLPMTRFITIGACIGLNNFDQWRTWKKSERRLDMFSLTSGKRWPNRPPHASIGDDPRGKYVFRTQVKEIGDGDTRESTKYSFGWDNTAMGNFEGQPLRNIVEEMCYDYPGSPFEGGVA
jgi:hypothetical protein